MLGGFIKYGIYLGGIFFLAGGSLLVVDMLQPLNLSFGILYIPAIIISFYLGIQLLCLNKEVYTLAMFLLR